MSKGGKCKIEMNFCCGKKLSQKGVDKKKRSITDDDTNLICVQTQQKTHCQLCVRLVRAIARKTAGAMALV